MQLARTILRPVAFVAGMQAGRQLRAFLATHKHTHRVQDAVLSSLIRRHRETAFGRDHDFASLRGYEDFAKAVPVRDYEALRPYTQRVFEGDFQALLPPEEQVIMFARSSGTTGKPKYIPVTKRFLEHMRRGFNMFGLSVLRDHPAAWLRPILQITSPMHEETSPTGLPCGAISGMLAATQKKIVRRMYVVPPAVAAISQPEARYYTTLRCGLGRDVAIISTANPSTTIKLIETGRANTERLLRDVTDGTLTPPQQIDPDLTRSLRFRPDPALARRLADGIRRDGQLYPRHFWNVAFLTNWTGGTLKLYLPRLTEMFGDVPIRDMGLLASEGRFTLPMRDATPAGVAEITANFLEFIPAESADSDPPPVLRADELEVGREYFLVVTNWAGLWRYNIDDRVKVTGILGHSPVLEFLSRGLNTANITGEKITEHQVVEAMRTATNRIGCNVERFVLQGHFADLPYYQLRVDPPDGLDTAKLAAEMDRALGELNVEYQAKRAGDRLGPIRALATRPGEMEQAEAATIRDRGGRSEQYKHQYLLTEVVQE